MNHIVRHQNTECIPTRPKPRRYRPMHNSAFPIHNSGFSLVELLVVIAIIILLVGILSPSIGRALEMGYKTKTIAAIQELAGGAQQYKNDTQYYPGQRNAERLGDDNSHVTGSQMLAACVFRNLTVPSDDHVLIDTGEVEGNYVSYNEEKTGTYSGKNFSISDRWPRKAMALLYYPSRLGNKGTIGTAFQHDDNSAYDNGAQTEVNFKDAIADMRFDSETGDDRKAYKADSFLLVGPGINRTYFETTSNDDVTNFD